MGVDTTMFFKLSNSPAVPSADELRQASYDLCDAFGREQFCNPGSGIWTGDTLTVADPELSEAGMIEVNWSGMRYYGPGYERGSWPVIAGVIQWLRHRFKDCVVYYGGDNVGPVVFTPEDESETWDHFAKVGNKPYYARGDYDAQRVCCGNKMPRGNECPYCGGPGSVG